MMPHEDPPAEEQAQRNSQAMIVFVLLVIALLTFLCLLQLMSINDALTG